MPPPNLKKRSRRVVVIATLVCLLVIGGGAAGVLLTRKTGPTYPKEWDPRIAPLAKEASRLRKLDFKRPVYVEFLTAAEYTKKSTGDNEDGPTKEESQNNADYVANFRAVGLMEGDVDLFKAGQTLADSGTLAFYSPHDKRVYIRGTEMTVDLKVTLVHELTHVLQDQNFDLARLDDKVDKADGDSMAERALVEGDATDVENRYVDSLSNGDRQKYEEAQTKDSDNEDAKKLDALPPVLLQAFGAPYSFGPRFISILKQTGGEEAVNRAFDNPPLTFAEIWNPFTYLDGQKWKKVDKISLPAGAKQIDDSTTGNFFMYLILAERTDPLASLDAADTWRGDASLVYKKDSKVCMDIHIETANTNDRNLLGNQWSKWSKAMPAGTATITKTGSTGVLVHTCDPGPKAKLHLLDSASKILAYPVGRLEVASQVLDSSSKGTMPFKVSPTAAECYSNQVLHNIPLGAITGDDAGWEPSETLAGQLQAALRTCVREHP